MTSASASTSLSTSISPSNVSSFNPLHMLSRVLTSPSTVRALILGASLAATYCRYKKPPHHYTYQLPSPPQPLLAGKFDPLLLPNLRLDEKEFLQLLEKFISCTEKLQNNPTNGLIPQEDLIADQIITYLEPFTLDKDSRLSVKRCRYVDGRSNLIITYKGTGDGVVSFVGSHMDVVPANRAEWNYDPFKLTREGDKLFGRGSTDCLGHCALLTLIMRDLARSRVKLHNSIVCVFIANEENSSILGVGIDEMAKRGELSHLRNGPLYWVDSAENQPTIGTGGIFCWTLTAVGKIAHSAFPQNGINALSLAFEAVSYIQRRFYADFPMHERCKEYKYLVGSSFKPTRVHTPPEQGITQIPRLCKIEGDCRFVPFDDEHAIKAKLKQYVKDLNENVIRDGWLRTYGYDNFVLENDKLQGFIQFEFTGHTCPGVAVNLESRGYKAICDATHRVYGKCEPFSLTGSLPIIASLQAEGFDVSVVGYGNMARYHAVDEYALLSEFHRGYQVVLDIIQTLDQVP